MKTNSIIIILLFIALFPSNAQETAETLLLKQRSVELRKEIIKVTENVYLAVGYDASNIAMIIGKDSLVIIDAGMIPSKTKEVYDEFRKITNKPIGSIILTHGHGDHTNGIAALLKDNSPQIWASSDFGSESKFAQKGNYKNPRQHRQGGMMLPPADRINNGIAPAVYAYGPYADKTTGTSKQDAFSPFSYKVVTHFAKDNVTEIEVSGVKLELIKTKGETSDHLLIWYPEKSILFPGDMIYRSFPNLYAIRGTDYRDVKEWINTLDIILSKNAEYLVMGHTRPYMGKGEVKSAVTNYRDAFAYVFNKTFEGMNKGMLPEELVTYVQLPKHLANDKNLTQYYGRVEWAVRNIHNGYLGWFDGNPTNLRPLTKQAEAAKMIQLAGGKNNLLKATKDALQNKDYQWCAQLCDYLLAENPTDQSIKEMKAKAFDGLAENLETAIGRNYYKTVARELRGLVK
jgi:uncharacterized sulfatase